MKAGSATCSCAALAASQDARLAQWRDVCTKFYYEHDAVAQRVLDHFENTTVDQIVIETLPSGGSTSSSHDEETFRQLLEALAVTKCAVAEHQEVYNDAVIAMERVKNEVRGGYHRYVASQNVRSYDKFDQRVRQSGQGTNYDSIPTANGLEQLRSHSHETHYVRSATAQADQQQRVSAFVSKHLSNIGCHPFLAGLRHVLEWNLSSTTVVAWKLSDAVFVESGLGFADEAVSLLVQVLNFGHVASPIESDQPTMRHRLWYIDPYMSDYDIKQTLKLLPPMDRLESRGTGEQQATDIARPNAQGTFDEPQPFLQRWCVIL